MVKLIVKMIMEPYLKDRNILAGLILLTALLAGSCGRPLYFSGALSNTKFYTYDGKNNSTYNSQGGLEWFTKLGAQIGAGTDIANLSDKLSLRTELNFSLQGGRFEDYSNDVTGSINLYYANVPVIFRLQTKSNFFGEGGVQTGFLIGARDRIEGNSTFYNDYIKDIDFGLMGGLGYRFSEKISLGLRGSLGLRNLSVAETDGKSNVVFSVGCTYTLGKK
jgi:hypothetical protein